MNKTKITFTILTSMIMGTALPIVEQPEKKNRWQHLKECLKGNEPCNKTDLLILAAGLLLVHSSFYAMLNMGRKIYRRESENFGDKIKGHRRRTPIGLISRKLNHIFTWADPGKLPETIVRKARKKWARKTSNNAGPQTR